LLAVGACTIAVVSCNGLLGLDGYHESACFPEASCADGTADSSGGDAEAGDGGAPGSDVRTDVVVTDVSLTDVNATDVADVSATDGPSSDATDSALSLPDGWASDGGASFACSQTITIPGFSGPPVWLPPTQGSAPWRSQLDDPRWAAGQMHSFPFYAGGTQLDQFDAQYRIVSSGNILYVSVQVLTDANGIDPLDAVYFGITGGSASLGAYLLEIPPDNIHAQSACSTVHDPACPIPNGLGPINYYTTSTRTLSPPSWAAAPQPPAWLSNVATWTNSPGVAWAVTFQVDTTSLAYGFFQMFLGARIANSGGTTVLLSSSSQASAANGPNPPIGDTPAGVNVTDWLGYDVLGGACPSGITISDTAIGVLSGGSITNTVNTCPIPPNPAGTTCTNTFRVEAQNVPAGAGPFSLRTRIRVADWGSTIADPNAPWVDFGISPDIFVTPGPLPTPPWSWSQTGSTVDIDYTCAVDVDGGARYCPALPGSTQPYQSILVEVADSPGAVGTPGFNVQTPAIYRNMAFGTLSTLSQPARISLKGLQAATGTATDRDVYLYVQTKNMPAHGRTPMMLSESELEEARREATHVQPGRALLTGDQLLSQAYPTYRVFAYYDSGRTVRVKGREQKVLVPMTPFGFYLSHKGTFYGFTHSLEFLDAKATRVGPNFYRVHVANEGEFHVRTTITAEESPAEDIDFPKRPPPRPAAVAAR
jgi:hypothetical protein